MFPNFRSPLYLSVRYSVYPFHFAAEDVSKSREGVVQGLVVDLLFQIFHENVSQTRFSETWIALTPHASNWTAFHDVIIQEVQCGLS